MQGHESSDAPQRARPRPFDAVFREARALLCLVNVDGTVLDANTTCLEFGGAERGDVVGQPLWAAPFVTDDHGRELARAALTRACAGERARFTLDVDGLESPEPALELELRPVRDERGGVELLVLEGRDVTELRRAREVEEAMTRAFEAMGAGAAFLGHEIKNPLTSVNLALRAVARHLGEDEKLVLDQLSTRIENLEQLVRRTFACVRPMEPTLEACDFEPLVAAALESARPALDEKDSIVQWVGSPEGTRVRVDPQLVRAALVELLQNAAQSLTSGGHLELEARVEGPFVLLRLEDDGCGIPAHLRERLFRPFVSGRPDGAGLGLAIAKRDAELCGGTLSLCERASPGACFELRLPRA
jgi:PAS domain S-box-containing protein